MIRRNSLALICALLFVFSAGILSAQTPPEQFLGFKVGADKKLADYTQITDYFKKLASETNKMKLVTIGETTLKKPMIMAVISAPENLAKLDRYREILKKLRDPRITTPAEAKQADQGRKADRPDHLQRPFDRNRRVPGVHGAGLRPGHGQDALRRGRGPQGRHPPPRPDDQSRRDPDGRRLV